MRFPAFFEQAPRIVVEDPLAAMLGAAEEGVLDYTYADVVKLAGHSCPTVASAYVMTARALERLYPAERPRRGEIRVEVRGAADEGAVGVMASVAALVTGAAAEGGFKGLAGRFARRNLLTFNAQIEGRIRFTRLDTGRSVEVDHHLERVPASDALKASLAAALEPQADAAVRRAFADRWQERVRSILIDHADDPAVVAVMD